MDNLLLDYYSWFLFCSAFPGFSCFYGDIQLHPVSSKVLPFTNWGSPAAFILLCASPRAGENTHWKEKREAALLPKLLELVWPEPSTNTVSNPQGMSLVHPAWFFYRCFAFSPRLVQDFSLIFVLKLPFDFPPSSPLFLHQRLLVK